MCEWVKEARFYHIYPLGFCGGEAQHIEGDAKERFVKLKEWIPHLKELNINVIYLGPVFESSEHGYDTSDYYQIDKRLGTNESFKEICDALHDAGIRIVLDGVFNHVGRAFWAFRDVQEKREQSSYQDWFCNLRFHEPSPMGDDIVYDTWEGYYNLVKLNLRNPAVVEHLLNAVAMWIDTFGIDGLRLDAADAMDRDFFRTLKQFCKQKKADFWLMGEIIHGDYNMWANKEMLDSVTNYECYKGLWSSHNTKNYFEIAYSLNRQFGNGGIYKHLCLYNFVDNHDVNRLASTLQKAEDIYNVYTLLYTMPGCPSIYYGSEWGIKGIKANGSDAQIRPCLNLNDIADANEALHQHLIRLGTIRKSSMELNHGTYEQIIIRNEQYVYLREYKDSRTYIALNLADDPYEIEFQVKDETYHEGLHHNVFHSEDGKIKLMIPPHSSLILSNQTQKVNMVQEETQTQNEYSAIAAVEERDEVTPGRYRHFKGNEYEVIDIATHSETLEAYVVYRKCYDDCSLWIRPLSMFQEMVEVDGITVPRFQKIDECKQ